MQGRTNCASAWEIGEVEPVTGWSRDTPDGGWSRRKGVLVLSPRSRSFRKYAFHFRYASDAERAG